MKNILKTLNTLVLVGSVVIITVLSIELLSTTTVISPSTVLRIQGLVCAIFLIDFVVRFIASDNRARYMLHNFMFLLVSIPYMNIVHWFSLDFNPATLFVFRLMPLVRGGYGIVIVISYITRSKITNLFFSYIVTIIATTYFASLVFFSIEKGVNPNVNSFGDAMWWAFMDVTTVGSNIYAVTSVGRVLSVVLAAAGMMMFPIFTVYITTRFSILAKK